ncbi:MAG: nuclear transport factor 2 family protein [Thermomicrobiales bacterium]
MTRWFVAIGVLFVLFFRLHPIARAQDVPSPPLVADYAAALNDHDLDGLVALYADDAIVDQAIQNGLVFRGHDAIRGWLAANLDAVPDLAISTEQVIAQGNQIAWAWNYAGTYTGQFPGYPAGTGQTITLRIVSMFELDNEGKIVRETLYYDNDAFLSRVGAMRVEQAAVTSGSVLVRVFVCPSNLADSPDASALASTCTPSGDTDLLPTLHPLNDDEPLPGVVESDGVYRWDDLPLGDYAVSGGVDTMTGFSGLRVTDATGNPVQNPALRLTASSPDAELDFYYFAAAATDS